MSDPTHMAQRAPFLKQLAEANEWRAPDFHAGGLMDWSPAERGNELAGEVGELCNELKKLLRFDRKHGIEMPQPGRAAILDTESPGYMGTQWLSIAPEESGLRDAIVARIRSELGDVIICASLVAAMFSIDLEAATRDKFNATSDKIGSGVKL